MYFLSLSYIRLYEYLPTCVLRLIAQAWYMLQCKNVQKKKLHFIFCSELISIVSKCRLN